LRKDERVHRCELGRASITGLVLKLRKNMEVGWLLVVG
jgi:hypothetical protein